MNKLFFFLILITSLTFKTESQTCPDSPHGYTPYDLKDLRDDVQDIACQVETEITKNTKYLSDSMSIVAKCPDKIWPGLALSIAIPI